MKYFLILLALTTTLGTARAEPNAVMESDFEWFGKLGFTDVKQLPFVRYCYGEGIYTGGRREEMWSNGFLLDDTAEKFHILTFDFHWTEWPKPKQRGDDEYRHEPADLRDFVEAEMRPPDPRHSLDGGRRFISAPHFSSRTHLFVLGWMCARKGIDDLAARLYEAAQTPASLQPMGGRDEKDWPFRYKLERDIGHYEMWRTIVDFGDTQITRRELLARLRALPQRFPHCDHLARAKLIAEQLDEMIAVDDTHPARTIGEIAALPPAQQAEEWIFRLRDQNGVQFMQPGWVDIFMTQDRKEDSPAHHLANLGEAAVPALIVALGDYRLTRSVGYGRNFYFSHEIITIGDAALKIIERIAGRDFYRSTSALGGMTHDGKVEQVRAAVQEWWSKRQTKGELAELGEATARGDLGSARTAATLLAKFPDDAATAILTGAAAAKSVNDRCEFIRLVGKLKDDRAPEFLLRETREGLLTASRAEAAWQLAKRGRTDGIPPLAELWRSPASPAKGQHDSGRERLIDVLAMTDSPEGIRALEEGLRERSIEARNRVIKALGIDRTFLLMKLGDFGRAGQKAPAPSAPTAAAIEDLLASEMEDVGSHFVPGIRDGSRLEHPRLCDDAAALLAARWPDRYTFDLKASYPTRESQRISCLNAWRKARGQSLLPPPPERSRVAAGDEMKIAEVVLAGAEIKWPDSVMETIRAAQGRVTDAALFRGIEGAFLNACNGKAPSNELGFFIDAFRENATDGVTVIAGRAERHGLAERPQRDWRLEYRAVIGEREHLDSIRVGLFDKHPGDMNPGKFDETFRKIAALPPDSPFHIHMELAPTLWDVDNAL